MSVGGRCERGAPRRRVLAALVVVSVFAGVVTFDAAPGGAAENGAWSIFPTAAANARRARLVFDTSVDPGQTYRDSVTVVNKTTRRISFNIYAADAFTTRNGSFSLHRRTDPRIDVAAWTTLDANVLNLAPRSAARVRFTVRVPKTAGPGDHVGGIVAEANTGAYSQHGQLGVTVLQAVGTRLYVRVKGPIRPALSVTGVHLTARRSPAGLAGGPVDTTFEYTISNTGNVRITTSTALASIKPTFGSRVSYEPVHLGELIPGSVVHVTEHSHGVVPFAAITADVRVTSPTAQAHASSRTLVVPWLLVAAVLALSAWMWRRRRRSRRRAQVAQHPGRKRLEAVA